VAIAEKAAFVVGLLISPFRSRPAVLVMALADGSMTVMYLIYLIGK
jgi:hypothetical protein